MLNSSDQLWIDCFSFLDPDALYPLTACKRAEMENLEEQQYVSYRIAHGDIEETIRLLNRAKTESDDTIKTALVKYCVISYARPFKSSKGVFESEKSSHRSRKTRFCPLESALVFPGGNSDHEALMAERDQRIAHSDMTAWEPTVHYWRSTDSFPIVQRRSQFYDRIDQEIETMLSLCNVVLRFLVDQMTILEAKFKSLIPP